MEYGRLVERCCVAALAALLLASPSATQSRRLNGPLAQPGSADAQADYAISADGARLVFRADALSDEVVELFSSRTDATGPLVRLSGPIVPGGDVVRFALGSVRTAYLADQDADEVFELYSVPSAGGVAPIRLSGPLVTGGDVLSFQLMPDGQQVVFLADKLVDQRQEFFRVPLDGSAAPLALDPAPNEGEVTLSWLAPDGARILFTRKVRPGPFGTIYQERLFTLALDGSGTRVQLAVPHDSNNPFVFPIGSGFGELAFSHDGQRVVYTDYIDGKDGRDEINLYSTAIDGSTTPVVLSRGPSNFEMPFEVSSSLDRVAFLEQNNAFAIGLDGTNRVQFDPPNWFAELPLELTPDGATVLFRGRIFPGGTPRAALFRARLDGSQPVAFVDGPGPRMVESVVPSNTAVFFTARESFEFIDFKSVYSAALDGSSPPVLLNGPDADRTGGDSLVLLPGNRLLFRNSFSFDQDYELYVVPRDGSLAPRRISAPMSSGRDVATLRLAPNGEDVVYFADQTFDSTFELFHTTVSGSGAPAAFFPFPGGPVVGDVTAFQAAPDGRSLVFLADQDTDQEFRFYYVPASGRAEPTRVGRFAYLNGQQAFGFAPSGNSIVVFDRTSSQFLYGVGTEPGASEVEIGFGRVTGPLVFTPDETRLVFRRPNIISGIELMSTALDGSGEPLRLFVQRGRDVLDDYQLAGDGRTVVYRADAGTASKFELFRIPVDGSQPAVRLNPAFAVNRDVEGFRLSPDGTEVVYLADQRSDGVVELFVMAVDGSLPARRLSATLATGGDVADFAFSPDGKSVVYRADQVANGTTDLFRVALAPAQVGGGRVRGDGEPVVTQLTFVFGPRAVQPDYRISVDGQQVFFRLNGTGGSPELYRVQLLGGVAPERLSPPMPRGDGVVSFELSADKSRLVYLADARGDGVHELFGVSVFGGPVVALDPLPAFADVTVYRLTPDSARVVYLCDRKLDGVQELFSAPLDGSRQAERVNDPLPAGGDVQPDFVVLADGLVVYRADQETDEVFEVFVARSDPR